MTSPDPLSLVGTTVADKYEIERVVGEGGFAIVYRARHTVWNRPVAIKVFRALGDLPADRRKGLVESFIQEGRLLADLSERSAAICQARDVGTLVSNDREMPYMVLEWLEGRSLEQVLDAEQAMALPRRPPEEALRILEPAAEALALAHRKGIAHRDVKPANIFVLGDPRGDFTVKLLDFGIAKVVQDAQRLGGSFNQTSGHVSSFTPGYGAPEQFSRTHGATGPWTDVFALALIFTEIVTQQPALRGDDLTQLGFSSMDPRRRPTPRMLGVQIPDALEAVLVRALSVSTEERYQNAAEFWDALRLSLGLEPSRAFLGTDPSRYGVSRPSQVSLAPRSGQPPNTTPVTHVSSGMPTVPAQNRKGNAVGPILGALVGLAVVGSLGIYAALFRGKHDIKAVTVASASATAVAAIPATPPPPKCPDGMAEIPGGKFFMGSDDKKDEKEERPAHQVTLAPYCMDKTEVTVTAYKACSDKGECKRAPIENDWPGIDGAAKKLYDPLCNMRNAEEKGAHPINCVDWSLADAFCKAGGKRLPTEAEWEFATRGSDGRKYPWGDEPPTTGEFLNACGTECVAWGKKHPDPENPLGLMYKANDGWETTAPVGSFPKGASPFGLLDVVGNVWEWTSDWFAAYSADVAENPTGPETGKERTLRGGSWNGSDPAWVRPTYRFKLDPKFRSYGIGMRCAKTQTTGSK